MSDVYVQVLDGGKDGIFLSWDADGVTWGSYYVNTGAVDEFSKQVRDRLGGLVKAGIDYQKVKDPKADFTTTQECGEALAELARAGHVLYKALFQNTDNRIATPEDVLTALAEQPAGTHIHFQLDNEILIPWGLVFPGDPRLPDYSKFWSMQYRLSAVYCQVTKKEIGQPWPIGEFQVFSVFDQETFDLSAPFANEDDEKQLMKTVEATEATVAYDVQSLEQKWQSAGKSTGLLYFLCHGTEGTLGFGGKTYSVNQFMYGLSRKGASNPCFVFLNGCFTALTGENGGFLKATAGRGFAGFIGTEAKVPNVFALRFSLAFLDLYQRGSAVPDAIYQLRSAHWPLSLLYSCYCPAALRMELGATPTPVPARTSLRNLSMGILGVKAI